MQAFVIKVLWYETCYYAPAREYMILNDKW